MTAVFDNDDAELVSQSLAGNRDAFQQIVERYQSLICSLAYSATGSLSQSEDLAQETFIAAWKHLSVLREPAKLRSWLCGIVRCLIGRYSRRRRHEPVDNAAPLEEISAAASSEPQPLEQTISREEEALLWRSLEYIPGIYREPLILFYRERRSIEAVATDLELGEDAVKQRLSRGRKLLQEQTRVFVQGTLEKTNPGKTFALGVVAALPLLAAAGARAATAGAAAKTGAALKMLFMTKTTKTLIVAAVLLAALTTPVALHYYWTSAWKVRSIHIRGEMRTWPADNFGAIATAEDFVPIDLWKQFSAPQKWRVEKPGRIAVMDGQTTILYLKNSNEGYKLPKPAPSAFDTGWLQQIAALNNITDNEIYKSSRDSKRTVEILHRFDANGREQSIATIEVTSAVPAGDYIKDKFIETADLREVLCFDDRSKRLESAEIYLVGAAGDVLVFKTDEIDYNQPIQSSVFHLDLPADVSWIQEPQKLPDNQRYASMTAQEAAAAFFEACRKGDWDEAGKFMSPITPDLKKYLGGLELIDLGQPFTSKSGHTFVPYEVKFHPMQFYVRVSNQNPAKRCVLMGTYDDQFQPQEDLKWSSPPEILTNNDVYAKLSPSQAVQAYFDAQAKFDWVEMRKFTSEYDVTQTSNQVEQAKSLGVDPAKMMPTFTVGDAVWSANDSSWFVKCQATQIKKWNLALRKDNAAKRWQVDGGI